MPPTSLLPPSENPAFSDLYPERKGDKIDQGKRPRVLLCQSQITTCLTRFPVFKLLQNAIQDRGCILNWERHFDCEYCQKGRKIQHKGNFDDSVNQVSIGCKIHFSI